jgi:hypothetical protein
MHFVVLYVIFTVKYVILCPKKDKYHEKTSTIHDRTDDKYL